MRLLIIHSDSQYFAGAQKLLGYFLEALAKTHCSTSVVVVRGTQVEKLIPAAMTKFYINSNQKFSVRTLWQQAQSIVSFNRQTPFDILHGWTARDWELTGLAGTIAQLPTVGTLHDHPQASFISSKRQLLMRWSVQWGLHRLICVSDAVRKACLEAGYVSEKLVMIHNGIPTESSITRLPCTGVARLGFLGAFSERKGLRGMFEIVDNLDKLSPGLWELFLAGSVLDDAGDRMLEDIRRKFDQRKWWSRVHWCGWVSNPLSFLENIDLLICPSSDFEPFGLVLCEAGLASVPIVATTVGGIPEIVQHGRTGWLFEVGEWMQAAHLIADLLRQPTVRREAGERGRDRVRKEFSNEKMAMHYLNLYSKITRNV
ncbi:MAG: glycosyltransferase family 4 protein [Verrucomicrobiota bacterium]